MICRLWSVFHLTAAVGVLLSSGRPVLAQSAAAAPVLRQAQAASELKKDPKMEGMLADRFSGDPVRQEHARRALAGHPADAVGRERAWQAYKSAPAQAALRGEWAAKTVSTSDRESPYRWRYVGAKPAAGWGLVIAMHGGGGTTKQVNDGEWNYMFSTYYRDHPESGGYIYLALRAPNDTWNGFYDDAICPLVEKLIKEFVLFAEVDSDRVYTLGASHGGYGAFVIGPKIPYRFAAVHAAASAPSDGVTMGENLRNTRFTFIVGEKDTAYGRADRCRKFEEQVETWRGQYGGFSGKFECPTGVGHLVPDHDELAEMIKSTRNPHPDFVVWTQSDSVLKRSYWVEAPAPMNQAHVEAKIVGNVITVRAKNQARLALWLDAGMVDMKKPVTVDVEGGKPQVFRLKPSLETYCQGLEATADPRLAAPTRIEVSLLP